MVSLADDFRGTLRWERKKKGFTYEDMAEKLSVSASTYGKLERGETSWTLDKVEAAVQIVFDR